MIRLLRLDYRTSRGHCPEMRVLGDAEYKEALLKKVLEETQEICGAQSKREVLVQEISDVLEIVDCICKAFGIKREEIEQV